MARAYKRRLSDGYPPKRRLSDVGSIQEKTFKKSQNKDKASKCEIIKMEALVTGVPSLKRRRINSRKGFQNIPKQRQSIQMRDYKNGGISNWGLGNCTD